MRTLKFILFLSLGPSFVYGQVVDSITQKIVSEFISCIKHRNKEKLANEASFPIIREYPLPAIKNKQEFLGRFSEVFDDSLIDIIANSQPSRDWSAVGWRGIMLFHGLLWLDDNGKLIAVNYQSKTEKRRWRQLVKIEKESLHESIRDFERPLCIIETSKYRIRIDDLGESNYRYCSWALKSTMRNKPELIIENGTYIPEGSGGDGTFEFKNGEYTYHCSIIVMGENGEPPAVLTIYKKGEEILSQKATTLKN